MPRSRPRSRRMRKTMLRSFISSSMRCRSGVMGCVGAMETSCGSDCRNPAILTGGGRSSVAAVPITPVGSRWSPTTPVLRSAGPVYSAAMHEANYGDGGGPDDPPGERGATRSAAGRRRRTRRLFAGVLTLLALWVVRDYLAALAWAVLIAVAAWPAYRRFEAAMPGRRTLAPALFTLFAGLVLLVPLALVAIE